MDSSATDDEHGVRDAEADEREQRPPDQADCATTVAQSRGGALESVMRNRGLSSECGYLPSATWPQSEGRRQHR
jgi:hypothetical protein